MLKRILFRLDAASFLGLGHAYQSLALAGEFKRRGAKAYFAMKDFEPAVLSWVSRKGVEVFSIPSAAREEEELRLFLPYLRKQDIRCVVVDHHTLGFEYCSTLRAGGKMLVVQIDDEGKRKFCCDVLINYNIYAFDLTFRTQPHTHCLLGPRYALLRDQFRPEPKKRAGRTNLLVAMGGGYARGEVRKVVEALGLMGGSRLKRLKPRVVLGPGFPVGKQMRDALRHPLIRISRNVANMRRVMEEADFAVSGGGGMLYEFSRMGLPPIIIVLDRNQELNARCFARLGIARNLGWYEDVKVESIQEAVSAWLTSPSEIRKRSCEAMALVDGQGSRRIADTVCALLN